MDLGESPKKKRSFYGQADRKGLPPLSRSAFGEFFFMFVWPRIMIICNRCETDFDMKKVIFIQLLESSIPLYCCCSVNNWLDGDIQEE